MDRSYDFDGIIRSIVWEETKYLRHYVAEVKKNTDELMSGRILVVIPSLGWDTEDKGQWARPRYTHGLSVPKVGEWVEVYFIDGSVNNLAYMGTALEMLNMKPLNYTGPTMHVLWEMPADKEQAITYNADEKKMTVKSDKLAIDGSSEIVFNQGTEKAVLGTALDTWISNTLKVFADSHLHLAGTLFDSLGFPCTGATGVASAPLTAPTNYLSNEIKLK